MLTKKYKFLILFLILYANIFAGQRYWVGNGSNLNWNSTSNWSSSSGGAGGASVPTAADTVQFDGNGLGKCSLNVSVSVRRISIQSGFTDTIFHSSNTFTVHSSGIFEINGGVFWGGSGDITDNGMFSLNGGVFRSTSGVLKIIGNSSFIGGTFLHNSGQVYFGQHMTISGSATFYDLKFQPANSGAYNLDSASILTCEHNLIFDGSAGARINTGKIYAQGDLFLNNSYGNNLAYTGGTATIKINGSSNQTIYGFSLENKGMLCNVIVDKPSDTLFLKDNITLAGNFEYVSGTLDVQKYNSTIIFTGGTRSITGDFTLKNLCFNSDLSASTNNFNVSDTITVLGEVREEGDNGIFIHSGSIILLGNLVLNNTYTNINMGGTGVIVFNGTTDQDIIGSTSLYASRICNLKVLKSSGNLILKNYITFGDNAGFQKINGQIDATTYGSTLIFTRGTRTISGKFTLNDLIFNSTGTTGTNNIQSTDTITVIGDLKLEGTNPLIINGGRILLKKDLLVTNTSTATTASTSTIEICGTGNQTFTGSGISLAGKVGKIVINKNSGILYLNSIITFIGDWNYIKGSVDAGSSTIVAYGSPSYFNSQNGENKFDIKNLRIAGSTTLNSNINLTGDLNMNSSTTLNGNSKIITIGGDWDNTGTFTYSGTTVIFNGSPKTNGKIFQRISKPSSSVNFYNIKFDKDTGNVYLNSPVSLYGKCSFIYGALISSASSLLTFVNGSSVDTLYPGGTNSYVCGPLKKIGNVAFTFPLGDTTLASGAYHPLSITAPTNSTDAYTARFYAQNQTYGSNLQTDSLESISSCEYFTLNRDAGTSVVTPTISWNSNSCNVDNFNDLRVAYWDSGASQWKSMGISQGTINQNLGTITAANGLNITALPLVIGKKKVVEEYPLLKRELDGGYYQAVNGKLNFKYDEEYADLDGKLKFNIYNSKNEIVATNLLMPSGLQPNVIHGDNRYTLNVLSCSFTTTGRLGSGFYILEVVNEKNEKRYLRFKNSFSIFSAPACPATGVLGLDE